MVAIHRSIIPELEGCHFFCHPGPPLVTGNRISLTGPGPAGRPGEVVAQVVGIPSRNDSQAAFYLLFSGLAVVESRLFGHWAALSFWGIDIANTFDQDVTFYGTGQGIVGLRQRVDGVPAPEPTDIASSFVTQMGPNSH
jgi:hypothetical protein